MNKELNNYTIDDFIKLKPIIYEYCGNLTAVKNSTSWFRDKSKADDLYQDVFLYVNDNYFNKPKPAMSEGKFIQIMKNCTYWTYYRQFNPKYSSNKIVNNLTHYQDNPITEYLFQDKYCENIKVFSDIQDNPDYNYFMKGLLLHERIAVHYLLRGYTISETAKKVNRTYESILRIPNKIENILSVDVVKKQRIKSKPKAIKDDNLTDIEFIKSKIPYFDNIVTNNEHIKLYSLYLQKINYRMIAKKLDKSVSQVNVEIYRINQKIKKYGS